MPMYKLIECSNNYSDTSGSLWQFKRDEQNMNNENLLMLLQLIHPLFNTNQVSQKNQLLLVVIDYLKM